MLELVRPDDLAEEPAQAALIVQVLDVVHLDSRLVYHLLQRFLLVGLIESQGLLEVRELLVPIGYELVGVLEEFENHFRLFYPRFFSST